LVGTRTVSKKDAPIKFAQEGALSQTHMKTNTRGGVTRYKTQISQQPGSSKELGRQKKGKKNSAVNAMGNCNARFVGKDVTSRRANVCYGNKVARYGEGSTSSCGGILNSRKIIEEMRPFLKRGHKTD